MISICIPVHNNNVTTLVAALGKQLQLLDITYEILIQNDASTIKIMDDTAVSSEINYMVKESITIMGRHGSRILLAHAAQYKWLLFLDADVLPASVQFIANYIAYFKKPHKIIYGGVAYDTQHPAQDRLLRWRYGRKKEMKPVTNRKNETYQSIISMAFAIKKSTFKRLSKKMYGDGYGQDILFSALINSNNIPIKHIENPVIHYGLDTNVRYVSKALHAIRSTYDYELDGVIPNDLRPVQRAYLVITRFKVKNIFIAGCKLIEKSLHKNLTGKNPRVIYLDLLKLYTYCLLKSN